MIVCPWKDILKYAPLLPGVEEAFQKVNALTDYTPKTYPLENGNRFFIASGLTADAKEKLCEAHRNYLDIQDNGRDHPVLPRHGGTRLSRQADLYMAS